MPDGANNPTLDDNKGEGGTLSPGMTAAVSMLSRVVPVSDDGIERRSARSRTGWVVRTMERDGAGILRILWRILRNEADVLDAYQDCFCKLASCDPGRRPANAKAYAYRTAANIAIEMIRTRARHAAHRPKIAAERARSASFDQQNASELRQTEKLQEALAQLPDHLRNVVVLRDLSRMSYKEVAGTLGIEATTARVYRRHAVVKLAEILTKGETDG